ncbi:NACHT domain-containing protein [Streptomyces sp. MB09-01]|uniref:NACHT domain-containing protein n=1 Tax=Streptomyces sp. MB09-01 TaxID=3028666 RepID=UPI0029B3A47F|nr:NACHT domain-containing protein [Streptomyces sp. MB09-01]MDX3538604.1 NACHT domain-containing protein [Streptomyces sp. MB09-01]
MARIGGRSYRRQQMLLVGVGGLLVTASVVWVGWHLMRGGQDAATTATLLGLPLTLMGLLLTAVGLRRRPEGDLAQQARGWASTLAEQVKEDEQRQWRQLIGDDTQRINLTFTLHPEPGRAAETPAAAGRLLEGTPTIPDVASYFRHTRPRRLVVTGAPGAGKSVLTLELMLALIEEREEGDAVPVRLSLAEWDTTVPLPERLARHLEDVYDWSAKRAKELIRQHRVLPVLDGLDEMDPTAPDGTPSPDAPRALAALRALNAYQDGRAAGPVILTCRTRHYEILDSGTRLLDAARIDIDRVTPPTARTYLLQRAPDPARWQPVLDALDADPTGTLATTLSTPWRLSLAATVYAHDGAPADLLRHATPIDLDEHLLARFIPAATALYARPLRPYSAADTHYWLARLAAYLSAPSPVPVAPTRAGSGPRTDLVLHQLWPMAGSRRVRATDALVTTLLVLLPLPVAWAVGIPLIGFVWIAFVLSACVACLSAAHPEVAPPTYMHLGYLHTKAGREELALWALAGLAVAPLIWLRTGRQAGLVALLVCGILLGIVTGLGSLSRREPAMSARPRDVIRGDLLQGLAEVVLTGTYTGVIVLLIMDILGVGIADALLLGLAVGLGAGVGFGTQSGRRYLAFMLCSRGEMPTRLGIFLDWACSAGLLRFSGAAYQFRHREFQQWLARTPGPPPV